MINQSNIITMEKLNDYIEIRSMPHIYAFSTNTIPNYVKVGDTFRPINKRLQEWKNVYGSVNRLFPHIKNELEGVSKIDCEEVYFRDYSLHKYLEKINKQRLTKEEFNNIAGTSEYFSNEFFKGVTIEDIRNGIKEIKESYKAKDSSYQYYKLTNKKPTDYFWLNDKDWKLRGNQEVVVNNFLEKCETENELLMYAVMRFGKSFTALMCAKAKEYKKVLVVSAKADVCNEWKKTVQMPKCFKEYAFITDLNLRENPNIIEDVLNKNNTEKDVYLKDKDRVVVFLTLQNLSGKSTDGNDIKQRLQNAFDIEYDLIIIDETHFGAWASTYGSPLDNKRLNEEDVDEINKDLNEFDSLIKRVKTLKSKIKLHLSGTPYNLLYDQEFTDKNIIATCQFSDILQDKERWEREHIKDIDEGVINPETGYPYEEFDNPYFGFPKMLRFAFNIPASTQEKLMLAQKTNNKWSLNNFLDTDKNGKDVKFIYEEDVLKLLQIIDGSKQDASILSFLDIPKIKDNNVCKHIVMVLPYKYSCDAMEKLLNHNKAKFKNLMNNCKVLNITGHSAKKEFESVDNVKKKIAEYEENSVKTITLTVNKMLTGVTVPEWDTMIMLKNTNSAQEYDQAVFRIQNQFVQEVETEDENGERRIAKIDKKPQTILVDFDPIRMFELQGLSTRIVNKVSESEISLNESINTELKYFPIITTNVNKLVEVTPTNIVEIISNYNKNKSILDVSEKLDFDESMKECTNIIEYLNTQSSKGIISKLNDRMYNGDVEDIDILIDELDENYDGLSSHNSENASTCLRGLDKDDKRFLLQKYRNSIAKLMFYAFLTKSDVNTLQDIYDSVFKNNDERDNNRRIFVNLKLSKNFILDHIKYCKKVFAFDIDNAICQANLLSMDSSLTKEQKIDNALARFSRISETEIVTPQKVCDGMYNIIEYKELTKILKRNGKILDISSKTGEFAVSLYNMFKDKVSIEKLKNVIYSIPTSTITYEFTRKIYEILGMPIQNIAKFNTYDLLDIENKSKNSKNDLVVKLLCQDKPFNEIETKDKIFEGGKTMKFDVVIGNPPYQETDGGGIGDSATPVYNKFVDIAKKLDPKYISIIMPSRWMKGGKGLTQFRDTMMNDLSIRKLVDYADAKYCFPNIHIDGGICYLLWDKEYRGKTEYYYRDLTGFSSVSKRFLKNSVSDTVIRDYRQIDIVEKIAQRTNEKFNKIVSSRNPYGLFADLFNSPNKYEEIVWSDKKKPNFCLVNGVKGIKGGAKRVTGYINKDAIKKNTDSISKYKLLFSKAYMTTSTVPPEIILAKPDEVCTETFLQIGCFENELEAKNCLKYIKTKFFRALLFFNRSSLNISNETFSYVPLQDFTTKSDVKWDNSIEDIDKQLYDKYKLKCKEIDYIEKTIKPMP